MWHGNYHFFDYKYNIVGYDGQDYMAPIQFIMCGIALAIIIALLIIFRNASKDKSKKMLFILGIVMTSLYLIKTTWESIHDIARGDGFNVFILPFDTCSLLMPTLFIAGLSKKDSKLEVFAATFLSTIGFAGGVANFIFLRGLKYYPMFTFGGLYSYFWHAVMIFIALYIPVTRFREFKWIDILNSMVCLLCAAVVVVPLNYIFDWDFMLLNGAGGVPLIEDICRKLIDAGWRPASTLLMLSCYFAMAALMVTIYVLIPKLFHQIKNKKHPIVQAS